MAKIINSGFLNDTTDTWSSEKNLTDLIGTDFFPKFTPPVDNDESPFKFMILEANNDDTYCIAFNFGSGGKFYLTNLKFNVQYSKIADSRGTTKSVIAQYDDNGKFDKDKTFSSNIITSDDIQFVQSTKNDNSNDGYANKFYWPDKPNNPAGPYPIKSNGDADHTTEPFSYRYPNKIDSYTELNTNEYFIDSWTMENENRYFTTDKSLANKFRKFTKSEVEGLLEGTDAKFDVPETNDNQFFLFLDDFEIPMHDMKMSGRGGTMGVMLHPIAKKYNTQPTNHAFYLYDWHNRKWDGEVGDYYNKIESKHYGFLAFSETKFYLFHWTKIFTNDNKTHLQNKMMLFTEKDRPISIDSIEIEDTNLTVKLDFDENLVENYDFKITFERDDDYLDSATRPLYNNSWNDTTMYNDIKINNTYFPKTKNNAKSKTITMKYSNDKYIYNLKYFPSPSGWKIISINLSPKLGNNLTEKVISNANNFIHNTDTDTRQKVLLINYPREIKFFKETIEIKYKVTYPNIKTRYFYSSKYFKTKIYQNFDLKHAPINWGGQNWWNYLDSLDLLDNDDEEPKPEPEPLLQGNRSSIIFKDGEPTKGPITSDGHFKDSDVKVLPYFSFSNGFRFVYDSFGLRSIYINELLDSDPLSAYEDLAKGSLRDYYIKHVNPFKLLFYDVRTNEEGYSINFEYYNSITFEYRGPDNRSKYYDVQSSDIYKIDFKIDQILSGIPYLLNVSPIYFDDYDLTTEEEFYAKYTDVAYSDDDTLHLWKGFVIPYDEDYREIDDPWDNLHSKQTIDLVFLNIQEDSVYKYKTFDFFRNEYTIHEAPYYMNVEDLECFYDDDFNKLKCELNFKFPHEIFYKSIDSKSKSTFIAPIINLVSLLSGFTQVTFDETDIEAYLSKDSEISLTSSELTYGNDDIKSLEKFFIYIQSSEKLYFTNPNEITVGVFNSNSIIFTQTIRSDDNARIISYNNEYIKYDEDLKSISLTNDIKDAKVFNSNLFINDELLDVGGIIIDEIEYSLYIGEIDKQQTNQNTNEITKDYFYVHSIENQTDMNEKYKNNDDPYGLYKTFLFSDELFSVNISNNETLKTIKSPNNLESTVFDNKFFNEYYSLTVDQNDVNATSNLRDSLNINFNFEKPIEFGYFDKAIEIDDEKLSQNISTILYTIIVNNKESNLYRRKIPKFQLKINKNKDDNNILKLNDYFDINLNSNLIFTNSYQIRNMTFNTRLKLNKINNGSLFVEDNTSKILTKEELRKNPIRKISIKPRLIKITNHFINIDGELEITTDHDITSNSVIMHLTDIQNNENNLEQISNNKYKFDLSSLIEGKYLIYFRLENSEFYELEKSIKMINVSDTSKLFVEFPSEDIIHILPDYFIRLKEYMDSNHKLELSFERLNKKDDKNIDDFKVLLELKNNLGNLKEYVKKNKPSISPDGFYKFNLNFYFNEGIYNSKTPTKVIFTKYIRFFNRNINNNNILYYQTYDNYPDEEKIYINIEQLSVSQNLNEIEVRITNPSINCHNYDGEIKTFKDDEDMFYPIYFTQENNDEPERYMLWSTYNKVTTTQNRISTNNTKITQNSISTNNIETTQNPISTNNTETTQNRILTNNTEIIQKRISYRFLTNSSLEFQWLNDTNPSDEYNIVITDKFNNELKMSLINYNDNTTFKSTSFSYKIIEEMNENDQIRTTVQIALPYDENYRINASGNVQENWELSLADDSLYNWPTWSNRENFNYNFHFPETLTDGHYGYYYPGGYWFNDGLGKGSSINSYYSDPPYRDHYATQQFEILYFKYPEIDLELIPSYLNLTELNDENFEIEISITKYYEPHDYKLYLKGKNKNTLVSDMRKNSGKFDIRSYLKDILEINKSNNITLEFGMINDDKKELYNYFSKNFNIILFNEYPKIELEKETILSKDDINILFRNFYLKDITWQYKIKVNKGDYTDWMSPTANETNDDFTVINVRKYINSNVNNLTVKAKFVKNNDEIVYECEEQLSVFLISTIVSSTTILNGYSYEYQKIRLQFYTNGNLSINDIATTNGDISDFDKIATNYYSATFTATNYGECSIKFSDSNTFTWYYFYTPSFKTYFSSSERTYNLSIGNNHDLVNKRNYCFEFLYDPKITITSNTTDIRFNKTTNFIKYVKEYGNNDAKYSNTKIELIFRDVIDSLDKDNDLSITISDGTCTQVNLKEIEYVDSKWILHLEFTGEPTKFQYLTIKYNERSINYVLYNYPTIYGVEYYRNDNETNNLNLCLEDDIIFKPLYEFEASEEDIIYDGFKCGFDISKRTGGKIEFNETNKYFKTKLIDISLDDTNEDTSVEFRFEGDVKDSLGRRIPCESLDYKLIDNSTFYLKRSQPTFRYYLAEDNKSLILDQISERLYSDINDLNDLQSEINGKELEQDIKIIEHDDKSTVKIQNIKVPTDGYIFNENTKKLSLEVSYNNGITDGSELVKFVKETTSKIVDIAGNVPKSEIYLHNRSKPTANISYKVGESESDPVIENGQILFKENDNIQLILDYQQPMTIHKPTINLTGSKNSRYGDGLTLKSGYSDSSDLNGESKFMVNLKDKTPAEIDNVTLNRDNTFNVYFNEKVQKQNGGPLGRTNFVITQDSDIQTNGFVLDKYLLSDPVSNFEYELKLTNPLNGELGTVGKINFEYSYEINDELVNDVYNKNFSYEARDKSIKLSFPYEIFKRDGSELDIEVFNDLLTMPIRDSGNFYIEVEEIIVKPYYKITPWIRSGYPEGDDTDEIKISLEGVYDKNSNQSLNDQGDDKKLFLNEMTKPTYEVVINENLQIEYTFSEPVYTDYLASNDLKISDFSIKVKHLENSFTDTVEYSKIENPNNTTCKLTPKITNIINKGDKIRTNINEIYDFKGNLAEPRDIDLTLRTVEFTPQIHYDNSKIRLLATNKMSSGMNVSNFEFEITGGFAEFDNADPDGVSISGYYKKIDLNLDLKDILPNGSEIVTVKLKNDPRDYVGNSINPNQNININLVNKVPAVFREISVSVDNIITIRFDKKVYVGTEDQESELIIGDIKGTGELTKDNFNVELFHTQFNTIGSAEVIEMVKVVNKQRYVMAGQVLYRDYDTYVLTLDISSTAKGVEQITVKPINVYDFDGNLCLETQSSNNVVNLYNKDPNQVEIIDERTEGRRGFYFHESNRSEDLESQYVRPQDKMFILNLEFAYPYSQYTTYNFFQTANYSEIINNKPTCTIFWNGLSNNETIGYDIQIDKYPKNMVNNQTTYVQKIIYSVDIQKLLQPYSKEKRELSYLQFKFNKDSFRDNWNNPTQKSEVRFNLELKKDQLYNNRNYVSYYLITNPITF